MKKELRDYLAKLGRKGGLVVTQKKLDHLKKARAAKAQKRDKEKSQ
jgi:hypothetical protein